LLRPVTDHLRRADRIDATNSASDVGCDTGRDSTAGGFQLPYRGDDTAECCRINCMLY